MIIIIIIIIIVFLRKLFQDVFQYCDNESVSVLVYTCTVVYYMSCDYNYYYMQLTVVDRQQLLSILLVYYENAPKDVKASLTNPKTC